MIALTNGTASNTFLAVNNVVLVVVVVGVANLWAQSGMGARRVALAAGLAVYDFVATSQLTLMTDLIDKLSEVPLVPFIAWRRPTAPARHRPRRPAAGQRLPARHAQGVRPARGLATASGIGIGVVVTVLALIEAGTIDSASP